MEGSRMMEVEGGGVGREEGEACRTCVQLLVVVVEGWCMAAECGGKAPGLMIVAGEPPFFLSVSAGISSLLVPLVLVVLGPVRQEDTGVADGGRRRGERRSMILSWLACAVVFWKEGAQYQAMEAMRG